MTKHHRHNKADRLTYPGATDAEIKCTYALAPFDRVADAIETKWGIDRLPSFVSIESAAKFGSAMAKLNAAIAANDPDEVAARAAVCIRGYAALDAEALAAGHKPPTPEVWEIEVDGVTCGLMRDGRDWKAAQAERPNLRLYTIREVQHALAAYGQTVAAVKDAFPGAQVVAVRSKLETELNDQIPF